MSMYRGVNIIIKNQIIIQINGNYFAYPAVKQCTATPNLITYASQEHDAWFSVSEEKQLLRMFGPELIRIN